MTITPGFITGYSISATTGTSCWRGDQISYLEGPFNIEVTNSTEGLGETSLTFKVLAARPVNINMVPK